jgi:hypothetical protein
MKTILTLILCLFSSASFAFEIYALGASAINCKGVPPEQGFVPQLEKLLRSDGIDVRVINGGVNGDKPSWMINRIDGAITPETKLFIFQPSNNEKNPRFNIEYTEKILEKFQNLKMPVIFARALTAQTDEEAQATAKKYGAYYYGEFSKGVPVDRVHHQFDEQNEWGGHMTAEGCKLVAVNMYPLVKKVISEQSIK